MSVFAAIAVFPILALLLVCLSKAENRIFDSGPKITEPVPVDSPGEIPLD